MSRYRKIEVRTWSDAKFRSLSPIPPCGQGLWFFLLTGPHTTAVPGLFRTGRAAMAEELEWDQEAFDKAFQEALDQGMVKADFKAKLVYLPKAISYNKPESPNVVRGWRVELDSLPECDLKQEAVTAIRAELELIGPAYSAAFDELFIGKSTNLKALPKASPKPSEKPSPKPMPNQEQEQEQEQEYLSSDLLAESKLDFEKPLTEFSIPLNDGAEYRVPVSDFAEWEKAYLAVDVPQELREIRTWSLANKPKRKTKSGVNRFIVNWLAKAQDTPSHQRHGRTPTYSPGNAWDGAK